MPECTICGGAIPTGSRTCSVCGSSADDFFPAGTMLNLDAAPVSSAAAPADVPLGGSYCPACAKTFGPNHTDGYCACGTELIKTPKGDPIAEEIPMAPVLEEIPMAPILDEAPAAPTVDTGPTDLESSPILKPSPGTPCLVLYGPNKQPLQYFALEKDVMLIGRLDAVAGDFPDIDLDEWFDRSIIRKISRHHAMILRTRASNTFALRPLTGNTGTQLEAEMVQPMKDYPLRPGHRIVLGGVIRLKFEIA